MLSLLWVSSASTISSGVHSDGVKDRRLSQMPNQTPGNGVFLILSFLLPALTPVGTECFSIAGTQNNKGVSGLVDPLNAFLC